MAEEYMFDSDLEDGDLIFQDEQKEEIYGGK